MKGRDKRLTGLDESGDIVVKSVARESDDEAGEV
jgi:hypothetical protein